ncbi:MAG: sigma-70 family RNA polymerase sigma factor [Flavobacteriaceae bacterium]|nr:sigma-70 family RNA polymerase sigma factor [Flavobacteriaceae bacterium]
MEQPIKYFKENNEVELRKMYNEHRSVFFGFARKYKLSDDELADIYQEAFLALRKHALSGKLIEVKCSLRTYLFGIGKYLIFNELKKNSKLVPLHPDPEEIDEVSINEDEPLTFEQKLLQQNFKKLGKKCQQVLTMFYYRGLTNEEISKMEGYVSEAVVRSQKSRCLKTLKEFIKVSI